jgi:putative peptidoglycan lipid II flippase
MGLGRVRARREPAAPASRASGPAREVPAREPLAEEPFDPGAARVVALGLVASKPAAYVREAVFAAHFGTGRAADAYGVATVAAQAAWALVGTPLQRVLVPILVRARARGGEDGLAATAGAILWAALAVSAALGLVLALGAAPLAHLLAGSGRTGTDLVRLLRWLAPLPLALTLSAYATGWLEARRRFTLPAFAALPVDLGIVACVLAFGRAGILAAAWGLVLGTALQFALQWPGMARHGFRAAAPATSALRDPGLREAVGMALPLWVSVGAQQAANLLQQGLAAHLGVGAVASLTYASRVLDLPSALFTLPVVTVALPHFAALSARQDPTAAERAVARSLAQLLAALVPSALLILWLRQGIAAAVFEHGAFGRLSVRLTAGALVGDAPLVVGYGLQELFRAFFYARQDVRTPMTWDLVNLAVTAGLDLALAPHLRQVGLALGMSVGTLVAGLGLWASAARRGAAVAARHLVLPLALGAAALTAVALPVDRLGLLAGGGWLHALVRVVAAGGLGAAAYVAAFSAAGGGPVLADLVGVAGRAWRRAAGPAG